jgi:hypothetical protein
VPILANQAAIIVLFRVINRYVGNLPPMPGVFPDYPAPVIRNLRGRARGGHDAMGRAATVANRWAGGHEHPQHVFTALAHLVETGESLPRASQQLRRVRT